jgi:sugar (pentulose or hexulose) kinase
VIRPALLWNDLRSAGVAADLVAERGGPRWWADSTGSVPTASFTVTKLRWLAEHQPANAQRVASPAVCALAPGVFGVDVDVPAPGEYVALGAARQAAWALAGTPQQPDWPRPPARRYGSPAPDLLARFAALRHATTSWAGGLPVPQATC